ncbi:S-layer homology domain-containing protein [Alkaliphilus transvaalensis]|uniref:S-layer homology domain-containing protein n=1 Tax=Alkaliphilus transvaalensis TaxID=114628 RepID=UPI00047E589A|nr:S-layer homology domain-containing protein [Alkaliphilus transvaalensis]
MQKKLKQRHSLILVILLLLQFIPINAFGIEGYTSHPVYQGMENGRAQLSNYRYNDVEGHWGIVPIYEMAGLGIMKGPNATSFRPNGSLTYLEALTVLVRAIGREEEAQRLGENQAPANVRNIMVLSAVQNWGKGYVQVATAEGIITNQEINEILNLTPQQQENLENEIQNQLNRYQGRDLTPQEFAALEAQVRDNIATTAIWNRPVPRQQVAVWVARALNLQPLYGENIASVYNFNDWRQIDTGKIPMIEAILQNQVMSGITSNTFSPRGNLTRAEMAQILFNINDDLLPRRGTTKLVGRIIEIEEVQQQGNHKKIFTVLNNDNSTNYLTIDTTSGEEFFVQKHGAFSSSTLLNKGDVIHYYITRNGRINYARVVPTSITTVEGFIEVADPENNRLAISDFNDKRHLFDLPSFAQVTINGKEAGLGDLMYGQEVKVTLRQGQVEIIEAYLDEDPLLHGYIPPGSRTKVGDVLLINSNEIELRVGNEREKYRILPNTSVTRNGNRANLFEVKVGDRVILHFDDIYSADIAQIRVEDDERHITGVYRGTLESVSERNKEMIINTVTQYENGRWNPHNQQKVKLGVEDQIYYQGERLTLAQLSQYRGKEVYVAVESSFGSEKAAKVTVKDGSTLLYESHVTGLQFGSNRMVVDNSSVNFNQGTIVVKNNRLVDILNLENRQSIYLVADLNQGARNAAFIAIEYDGLLDDRIDGTRLVVYRGRIESMADYSITLGRLAYQMDYLRLQDHKWSEVTRPKQLTVTEDSYIYDSEIKVEIESSIFLRSRFIDPNMIQDPILRARIRNNHYVGKSAFVVVKETTRNGETTEEVISINLTPQHLHYQNLVNTNHSAIADIGSINLDTNEITLTNLRHWNALSNRWEAVRTEETVSMEKAVIIVNDRPIDREEFYRLRERARVYVIKSKNVSTHDDAYIVIVEQ